jgi:hypothetical protein
MSSREARAQGVWPGWLLLLAGFTAGSVACGRSVSRSDGTAGTAASTASQGGASAGGSGGVGGTGGTGSGGDGGGDASTAGRGAAGSGTGGSSAGSGASSGSGGDASTTPANPAECVAVPTTRRTCISGCAVKAAFALRCPSSLMDLELAGSNLLVEHGAGAGLFGFADEDGLVALEAWGSFARRELAVDGDSPIVVHEDGGGSIVVSSSTTPSGAVPLGVGTLLDAGFDARALRILGANEGSISLFSIAADGSVTGDEVHPDASSASLLSGSSPPWVSVALDDGAWLYGQGEPRRVELPTPVRIGTNWFSAVSIGARAVLGSLTQGSDGTGGTYVVNDDGVERTFGYPRTLSCPVDYTANYPDICEFDFVPAVTTSEAVLAAELVAHDGDLWLVSIVGKVTDRCDAFVGRCFESLPCDCEYRRFGSIEDAVLRFENLDAPGAIQQAELGDFPNETVQLAASSSETGALFVAVAEGQFTPAGDHAGVYIDYFVLRP